MQKAAPGTLADGSDTRGRVSELCRARSTIARDKTILKDIYSVGRKVGGEARVTAADQRDALAFIDGGAGGVGELEDTVVRTIAVPRGCAPPGDRSAGGGAWGRTQQRVVAQHQ